MSISIQTNVDSLVAQQNLSTNSSFQSRTIQQLTSGHRINSSADDAAGLAIANGLRSSGVELNQGVRNANDGVSTLQIVDGGMNNVSQMLDTLRTLATQSASGTFTGDRSVLNNQFQSLLTEVDRQAQAIGLNQGGQFAKSLSVYIGGGKAAGTGAFSTSNGTVNINLSNSAVDTQSLGLKGNQVVAGTTDVGTGSTTSVAAILANTNNTTAIAGFSELDFAGPGFSDGSQVKISVNTQGVTDVNSLATAINTAIQTAGNGSTQAASAFKNAGIVASVHTDASGGSQLAFTSATTAFQVQAGDKLANAFLGNLTGIPPLGNSLSTTSTGGATASAATAIASPANVAFQISGGGLTSPVTLNLASGSTTEGTAVTDLSSQVANNTALKAAGITVSGGTGNAALVFTNAQGNKLNVQVTGDTANALGFGSFVAGASPTTADYTSVTGAGFATATATGNAQLEFSFNGGASAANNIAPIDLAGGDATAATTTGSVTGNAADASTQALTISIDGATATSYTLAAGSTTQAQAAADINGSTLNTLVTASVSSSGALVLTAVGKGGHQLTVGGAAATTLGVAGSATGTARSAQSISDAINTGIAANTNLQAAGLKATVGGGQITIASTNGTAFRLNAGGSTAAPGGASPSTGANIGFGVAGAASFAGPTVTAAAQTFDDANGVANTGALAFNSMKFGGDTQAITISGNNANGDLQSKTITLQNNTSAKTGQSIDSALAYINTQLQQSNNSTLQSITAVKENSGGTEKINFISSLSSFSVSVGSSANGNGFASPAAGSTVASTTLGAGATVSIDSQAGAVQALTAVAAAVTKLGNAQAAVGQGQNQLNYATGLAQSQITNFAAAESRIRDTDVAAQAANLTKSQVLNQASIAAMAQANTEPQAILSLLHG